jgi:hypothetical protein
MLIIDQVILASLLSEKGGTGKTTFCRALADRLRRDNTDSLLVDGDGTVGQLVQFYGEGDQDGRLITQTPEKGVMAFSMTGTVADRDTLVNMLEHKKEVVLSDLPAGSITFLSQMESELGLFELIIGEGYEVTLVNVISPYRASTRTVAYMIELGDDKADYVVVENAWFGSHDDYLLWYGNKDGIEPSKGKQMLEAQGGIMIMMPRLEGRTCALIDTYNLPYWRAKDDTRLPIADRSRTHRWLKAMDAELDKGARVLGIRSAELPRAVKGETRNVRDR